MTLAVGIILIAVFLAFARQMFMERLSTLLALPLMALAFVIVATMADVLLVTSSDGMTVEQDNTPTRFAAWREYRSDLQTAINSQEQALRDLIAQAEDDLNDPSLTQKQFKDWLASAQAQLSDQRDQLKSQLSTHPNFFHKPPFRNGTHSTIDNALDAIPIKPLLNELKPLAYAANSNVDQDQDQIQSILSKYQEQLPSFSPSEPSSSITSDAIAYIGGYFGLTIRAGSLYLYATIIATLFGGMFAMYVSHLKIADRLVYWTAEFGGERPALVAFAVFIATAVIFTSVGGLGTVIMIGTIILPVLRSIGLSPIVGAGVFLIAISMGGTVHPVSRRLWMDFYQISPERLDPILWTMVSIYFTTGLGWIFWGTRKRLLSSFQSEPIADTRPVLNVPPYLMISPIIPVAMVYLGNIDEIVAFTLSIAYMFLCVAKRDGAVRNLARSLIEGAQAVVPPVMLMIGIGLLIVALQTPPVQGYMKPLIRAAAPENRWAYIAVFALFAPLALYRGPLNVWGMGLAVSAILMGANVLPPAAILGAILAAGMLQGVCDPTNTANVWIAGFQGISVNRILRYTLAPIWIAAAIAVTIFAFRYVPA